MCHREEAVGDGVFEGRDVKQGGQGDNNNNSEGGRGQNMAGGFLHSQGWAETRPSCSCLGDRRVRRRHPATVQTPGRSLVEGEVMEPLVSNRLQGERLSFESSRDFNDNFSCDQEKFYEVQFAMDFSNLRVPSPQRFGTFDDSQSAGGRENLKKNRILSSKLK